MPGLTSHEQCLEHLKELDQRAKETWQRPEIPNRTWEQSKSRLLHSNLCNMHHGLENMPWDIESHKWHGMAWHDGF
ncbi:hypothetical protein OCU04_003260 [Sclerotinia nivalis]|uniref:Uncharacterized protein n=1 Tax=Sclerotinia nivalis TaxID=352851 RepID=A0A9X0DN15_9HELO|nr:hypothetical protein OCU04_003260 [Sclerotinia nivalis]